MNDNDYLVWMHSNKVKGGGKKLAGEYFIVHPIDPIDCLTSEASGARVSRIGKGVVAEVQKLCLKPDSIPNDRGLVRIATFRKPTLVRRDIAQQLDATGFTGFRWLELSAYPEI